MIKSRCLRRAGHVARVGESRDVYSILLGEREGQNHLEDLGVSDKIILKLNLKVWNGSMCCSDVAQDMDRWRALECGNEPSSSIKCGKFRD